MTPFMLCDWRNIECHFIYCLRNNDVISDEYVVSNCVLNDKCPHRL